MGNIRLITTIVSVASFVFFSFITLNVQAAEDLNCFICHKHRGLSRIDENGDFRLFYINKELFDSGPHRRNKCKDCHTDVDRIPHDPAEKIDCTKECHITEPSSELKYSHQNVADILAQSVHSKLDADGNPKEYQEDYPGCKDCHEQPMYRPFSLYKGKKEPGVAPRGLSRCKGCHTEGDFAEDFYEHVTSRMHKTRLPIETIDLCAKCHEDPELIERHDMHDAVETYKETFHGKLVLMGSEKTPDCIDCHVIVGENTHLIEPQNALSSAVHKNNLSTTCRTSDCHSSASDRLSEFRVHVTYEMEEYPMEFYMLMFFKSLMVIVLYFFLIIIFFELMRRLFPNFAFFKDKNPDSTPVVPETKQ